MGLWRQNIQGSRFFFPSFPRVIPTPQLGWGQITEVTEQPSSSSFSGQFCLSFNSLSLFPVGRSRPLRPPSLPSRELALLPDRPAAGCPTHGGDRAGLEWSGVDTPVNE